MKTMLEQSSQSRLEARDGILCVVLETALDGAASKAGSPAMRQWFRVEEPGADPALVAGRPVRNIDPQEGLFIDEEGNSYRLVGGGQAKPDYAEVLPVKGGPRLEVGAAPPPTKQRGGNGNGLPATGRRRRKGEERPGAITNDPFSEQPNLQELNLREKFAEVRRRLGYVRKRGHNERHNYNYVTAADLAGSVGDILAELGVIVIPQLQSISTETPRSSSERIARIVMNYRFVDARSGEELTVRVAGEGADAGDKAPYKAMTGALKYALLQSFLLATGDDPEEERTNPANHSSSPQEHRSEPLVTAEEMHELRQLVDDTGTELERVLAYYRLPSLEQMTEGTYRRAIEVLNRKKAKQTQAEDAHAQD
jgi:ERF superfamily